MRKPVLLTLFLMAASSCLLAQSSKSNEQAEVKEAVTKFFDCIATLDTKMMKQYLTKDFLLLENGAVWNMDTLVNKLNPLKAMSFSRTNHLDFIETEVKGNTAWVAYNNAADISAGGQKKNVQWLETAVLVKEGKNWKIRMLHSTLLLSKDELGH